LIFLKPILFGKINRQNESYVAAVTLEMGVLQLELGKYMFRTTIYLSFIKTYLLSKLIFYQKGTLQTNSHSSMENMTNVAAVL